VQASIAQFLTKIILMPCTVLTSMPMLKITNLSSCVVATILEGASCYVLAPIFFSFIMCLATSFPLPHLVLTITTYYVLFIFLTNPFTKPRTVLLSIHLSLPCSLPIALAFLPIPSSLYPRMYYT
jgi:hypothetical protein